jgi:hypothetical protein
VWWTSNITRVSEWVSDEVAMSEWLRDWAVAPVKKVRLTFVESVDNITTIPTTTGVHSLTHSLGLTYTSRPYQSNKAYKYFNSLHSVNHSLTHSLTLTLVFGHHSSLSDSHCSWHSLDWCFRAVDSSKTPHRHTHSHSHTHYFTRPVTVVPLSGVMSVW